MKKLVWDCDGKEVRVGSRVHRHGEVTAINSEAETLTVSYAISGPITAKADHIAAHWAEVLAIAMPEIRSLHDQALFDFFREFRYATVTTGGIGNGTYSRALAWIDNEVRIRVAEALKQQGEMNE